MLELSFKAFELTTLTVCLSGSIILTD